MTDVMSCDAPLRTPRLKLCEKRKRVRRAAARVRKLEEWGEKNELIS